MARLDIGLDNLELGGLIHEYEVTAG